MRIAVFEDLPSGGARRTAHEVLSRLKGRHRLVLFSLSTSNRDFCDLAPFVSEHHTFPFEPYRLFRSPFGRLNQVQRVRSLRKLVSLGKQIAARVDRGGFDAVFSFPCMWTQAPLFLTYVKTPSLYFCPEVPRPLYEEPWRPEDRARGYRAFLDSVDPFRSFFLRSARALDAAATRAATLVVANSHFSADAIRRTYGVSPEVWYHGVDPGRFCATGSPREAYVLSVGAIHPRKGFDFLIRVLGLLPPHLRPPLVLVGDSESPGEAHRLAELAKENEVRLTIEVAVPDSRLIEHYRKARLMLYSPHLEPLGLAPLEAMACGLAVLGVNEGGVRETVVDGVTGRRLPRDPAVFAAALTELLQDPGILDQWGERGRAEVEQKWTWDGPVERIEALLQSLSMHGKARVGASAGNNAGLSRRHERV